MSRDPYRSSANDVGRRDYDRVMYERERGRYGDERSRYEDDELDYTTSSRRPAPPPTRLRERSPSPRWSGGGRGGGRTFEDDERIVHERRYFDEASDVDSLILPASARRRQQPPAVIPDDFDREVTIEREKTRVREDQPPPARPGHLIRRQSSLDTFDRRPARRAYDYERLDDPRDRPGPRPGVPIPLPHRRRRDSSRERSTERITERTVERGRGHDQESEFSEFDEIRIEPGRYEPPRMQSRPPRGGDHDHEYVRETEIVRTKHEESRSRSRESRKSQATRRRSSRPARSLSVSSEESETSVKAGRNEYPKKGKTRIPARLVSERVLIDLGYPFIKEGSTIIVQVALGQDNIDDVLRLSRDYKKNETEVIESKTSTVKTSGGDIIEERRREEFYMTPAQPAPPPAPAAPMYAPAPERVAMAPPMGDYTTVKIRDVSPARSYTTVSTTTAPSTAMIRARSRSRPAPVIIDAGSPAVEYSEEMAVGPLALVSSDDRHRHRHRHSRSHSHGDGALYARVHDRHDRHGHGYYYEERDYYDSPSRELVRAERLSTGEVVLYEEQIEVEPSRHGVRIEKDRKGRMAISVPKYRY